MRETNDDSFPHTLETQVNALAKYKRKKGERKRKRRRKRRRRRYIPATRGASGSDHRRKMFDVSLRSSFLAPPLASGLLRLRRKKLHFGCREGEGSAKWDLCFGVRAEDFLRLLAGCPRLFQLLVFLVHLFQWVVMGADVDAHKHTRVQFSHICILCY